MRAPGPSRNDGLNTPPRQLGAEVVDGINFVRDPRSGRTATRQSKPLPKHRSGVVGTWPSRAGTGAALLLHQAMDMRTLARVLSSHCGHIPAASSV